MRVELDRAAKIALLKAIKAGYLETDDIAGIPTQNIKVEVVNAKDEIKRLEELKKELGYGDTD